MSASLTGHLVLSTLHTNDAPSAFNRLTDIGSVLPETLIQPAEPVAVEVTEAPRESLAVLKLEGIAWNPKRPFAFVNGSVVGIGDRLQGFTVTEIGKDKVVLEDANDRRRELQLYD